MLTGFIQILGDKIPDLFWTVFQTRLKNFHAKVKPVLIGNPLPQGEHIVSCVMRGGVRA